MQLKSCYQGIVDFGSHEQGCRCTPRVTVKKQNTGSNSKENNRRFLKNMVELKKNMFEI